MPTNEQVVVFVVVTSLVMFIIWLLQPRKQVVTRRQIFWQKFSGRTQDRRNNRNSVRVFVTCASSGRMCEGWVIDTSDSGMALYVGPDVICLVMKVGQRWSVKATKALDYPISVEVRNFSRDTHGWRVGCKFLKDVPPSTLKYFQD